MLTPRIRTALVVLAASAGLGACTNLGPYGGIGVGVGTGYGGYGGYGYDPYYAGYGYGSGYGYNPYGWYNGYYYPGSGYWVYDRDKNRRPLTDAERAYWNERIRERIRRRIDNGTTATAAAQENWSGFEKPATAAGTVDRVDVRAQQRQRALEQRAQRQQVQSERQQARSERQEIRQRATQERTESRRVRRGSTDD